ncbi:hypothetical protein T11_13721 [Trichinella zimbabwensis]|uniref:Uncharacterized protein n=1 Tax=Trichinella zimbabwensis TaxID=268475 RepID=A0A0V1I5P7_9BILA|nr:hypothetical protein T11_13721 [Trichinella zimbabwensis]
MNSRETNSCLPKNVCKFLYECCAFTYVALDSMGVGALCMRCKCSSNFPAFKIKGLKILLENKRCVTKVQVNETTTREIRHAMACFV